jgi:cytochrome c biogenesis protein
MTNTPASKGIFSQVIDFFASVKLAIVILIALAATSVIGTVLPQGEPLEMVVRRYGPTTAKLIGLFQLQDMYHSWWFQWLLLLLSANLIVCSLKRFSSTWKVIQAPPRSLSDGLFETLPFRKKMRLSTGLEASREQVQSLLGKKFKSVKTLEIPSGLAFYAEKGRYSRLGVYLVHFSILVIFAGAIAGSLWGFKGFMELKEGETKDKITITNSGELRPLGFSVRCDRFQVSFYENGMPKEYRSDLAILEGGREIQKASIRVNDPFTYQGITFYQSTWDRVPSAINLSLTQGEQVRKVTVAQGQITEISGTPYSLSLERFVNNLSNFGPALGLVLLKDRREVDHNWILVDHPGFHGNQLADFRIKVEEMKTRYVTGMQVNQDPGIWFIWVGSILMLLGFIVAFYFSHQQVWVWVREKTDPKGKTRVELDFGGTAHKNRTGFVASMERLVKRWEGN